VPPASLKDLALPRRASAEGGVSPASREGQVLPVALMAGEAAVEALALPLLSTIPLLAAAPRVLRQGSPSHLTTA